MVSEIQDKLSSEQIVRDRFVIKLLKYGLHLDDIPKYCWFIVEKEQFYTVVDGFPRIINFDDGVGDVNIPLQSIRVHHLKLMQNLLLRCTQMDENMVNFQLDLNEDIDHRAVANDCMKEESFSEIFCEYLVE